MRTWNFKSGATIEAEIVAFPDPLTVEVKRPNGQVFTLPAAYLADADRSYLAIERARQWKEVSVDKVLGTAWAGRYKKCAVSGQDFKGEIFVALLPAEVEAALNSRHEQESQLTNLNSRIQYDTSVARNAKAAAARRGSRAYQNAARTQARLATQDEKAAKASLTKLKADYAASVKATKTTTTVLMKKTGVVCHGLPVWECKVPLKWEVTPP
jgi:hypothetical protein